MFAPRIPALALIASLLAGCAAQGPAFSDAPPPGGKALVYIYRPYSQWVSALQDAGFEANGKRIGFLDTGGYTFFHAPPGHYDIRQFWPVGLWTLQEPALWKDLHVSTDVAAGQTRYFRLQVREAAPANCSGPASSTTEPAESRYFTVSSSTYDANTGASYPIGNWCVGLNLAEVPASVARSEISAQKFQAQNKAMPAEYRP
jgi:hypothetical protein